MDQPTRESRAANWTEVLDHILEMLARAEKETAAREAAASALPGEVAAEWESQEARLRTIAEGLEAMLERSGQTLAAANQDADECMASLQRWLTSVESLRSTLASRLESPIG